MPLTHLAQGNREQNAQGNRERNLTHFLVIVRLIDKSGRYQCVFHNGNDIQQFFKTQSKPCHCKFQMAINIQHQIRFHITNNLFPPFVSYHEQPFPSVCFISRTAFSLRLFHITNNLFLPFVSYHDQPFPSFFFRQLPGI